MRIKFLQLNSCTNALNLENDDTDERCENSQNFDIALFQIGLSNARAICQQPSMMIASTVISCHFEALI